METSTDESWGNTIQPRTDGIELVLFLQVEGRPAWLEHNDQRGTDGGRRLEICKAWRDHRRVRTGDSEHSVEPREGF